MKKVNKIKPIQEANKIKYSERIWTKTGNKT